MLPAASWYAEAQSGVDKSLCCHFHTAITRSDSSLPSLRTSPRATCLLTTHSSPAQRGREPKDLREPREVGKSGNFGKAGLGPGCGLEGRWEAGPQCFGSGRKPLRSTHGGGPRRVHVVWPSVSMTRWHAPAEASSQQDLLHRVSSLSFFTSGYSMGSEPRPNSAFYIGAWQTGSVKGL